MFKYLHELRMRAPQAKSVFKKPKRFNSNFQMKPPSQGGQALSWALAGAGTAGLAFLLLRGRQMGSRFSYEKPAPGTQ